MEDLFRQRYHSLPLLIRNNLRDFTQTFKSKGYECFLVGGSCRDLILGEPVEDFDFATNAPLEITEKLFQHVIRTGVDHGTLTVFHQDLHFEVTRYRKDVESHGRRATIVFAETIEEDLERRDLRINAVAYDIVADRIVDSQGGVEDLRMKKIHFVGDPVLRIAEDHLRAIRYGRYIAKLKPYGFTYDQSELDCVVQAFDGSHLSIERIYDELKKVRKIKDVDKNFLISFFQSLGLFSFYIDEESIRNKVIQKIIEHETILPLPFYYHKNSNLKETGERLKVTRLDRKLVHRLTNTKPDVLDFEIGIKELLSHFRPNEYQKLVVGCKALLDRDISSIVNTLVKNEEPIYPRDLQINGNDIVSMGVTKSKIGEILHTLLTKVWDNPDLNHKNILLPMAQKEVEQFSTE